MDSGSCGGARQAFSFSISGGELQHCRRHLCSPETTAAQPPTVRGDGEQQQQGQEQQQDKWTCPCGGSCSDELTRLETRLSAMEGRLAEFEALLRSCPPRSLSGDAGSRWPESATTGDVSGGDGGGCGGGVKGGFTAGGGGEMSALNLVFSDDQSSSAWTDLGSRAAAAGALPDVQQQQQQQPLEPQAQKQQPQPEPQEQHLDESSSSDADESFELVRYSTQETYVHQQQQQDSASFSTGCLDAASASPLGDPGRRRPPLTLRQTNNSLRQLNVALGRAEQLATPRGERGSAGLLTPVEPRDLAEPPASLGVSSSWARPPVCRQLPSAQSAVIRSALSHPPSGEAAAAAASAGAGAAADSADSSAEPLLPDNRLLSSSETATGGRAVDLVVRSSVSRVRRRRLGGGGDDDCDVAADTGVRRAPPPTICRGPAAAAAAAAADDDDEDEEVEKEVAMDCGATVSTVSSAATTVSKDVRLEMRTIGSSSATCRPGSSRGGDCRLCDDLVPYARKRLRDLERDGLLRCRRRSSTDVCIQRSGFSQLDTVLIAGLALKAASLFESEGDQASYVRLALRKMGFECAVVIGRHFTGCICGMDSSRLLLDIGERSCLIFSFFELSSELSQASSAK